MLFRLVCPGLLYSGQAIEWQTLNSKNGLSHDFINVVCASREYVYIGTKKGLNIYSKSTQKLISPARRIRLPHENVLSLLPDQDSLWIGTTQGLALWHSQDARITDKVRKLNGRRINAIVREKDEIYLGTNNGLFKYQPEAKILTALEALEGRDIAALEMTSSGLLMIFSNGLVELFNLQTKRRENIRLEFNPSQNKVTAARCRGDYIWFATEGSGLIGHNMMKKKWVSLSRPDKVDAFLTVLAVDGKHLWCGTFLGLFRYHQEKKKWSAFPERTITDSPITTLAVDGEYIWIGTEERGVVYGNKKTPNIKILLAKRYFKAETAEISGIIQGSGNLTAKLSYHALTSPGRRLTRQVVVSQNNGEFRIRVNFKKLLDNAYQFQISVQDSQGNQNTERFTLVKKTKPSSITFDFYALRTGLNKIQGKYRPHTIDKIILYPGQVSAVLDQKTQTFKSELSLLPTDTRIKFKARDFDGRIEIFTCDIKVKGAPKLDFFTPLMVFTPGIDEVKFAITRKNITEPAYWEILISTPAGEPVMKHWSAAELPSHFIWDGKNQTGQAVARGNIFYYSLKIKEKNGFEMVTPKRALKSQAITAKPDMGKVIKLSRAFLFDPGKAVIKPAYLSSFDELRKIIKQHPKCAILIEGHTDNRPLFHSTYVSNQKLSEARAATVADYARKKFFIDKKMIAIIGYGADRPIANNDKWTERAKNRRVEVSVLQK